MHISEKKLEAALCFIHFLLSFTLIFPVLIFRRASCGRKWTSVTMWYGPALLGWNSGGVSSAPCTPAPLPILCSVPPSPGTVGQPGWTLPPTLPISLPACFSPSKWGVISEIFFTYFFCLFFERSGSLKKTGCVMNSTAWLLCFHLHLSALHLTDISWNFLYFNGSFPVLMCVCSRFYISLIVSDWIRKGRIVSPLMLPSLLGTRRAAPPWNQTQGSVSGRGRSPRKGTGMREQGTLKKLQAVGQSWKERLQ